MTTRAHSVLIHRLTPRNFLSFGPENTGIALLPLNLFIGPNGSGKSNLIEAISFMRASLHEWRDLFRRGGGAAEWIWKGDIDATASVEMVIQERPRGKKPMPLRHCVAFRREAQTFEIVRESVESEPSAKGRRSKPFYKSVDGVAAAIKSRRSQPIRLARGSLDMQRSIIGQRNDPEVYPELAWLSNRYKKIRIYREWSIGVQSSLRQPQPTDGRSDILEEDFSNLGMFLGGMKRDVRATEAILEGLRELYDGLTDFEVVVEGGTVQIYFIEGEFSVPASRLSDGSLRYLCLLAILCDPKPPALICIEEPELGLHPDILPKLAHLLKTAARRSQIVVTTHSDILVDAMTDSPESVVICEKHDSRTEMRRLAPAKLKAWLREYRLGQLWIDGQIGGKRW